MALADAVALVQRTAGAARGQLSALRAATQGVTGQMSSFASAVRSQVAPGLTRARSLVGSLRTAFPRLGGAARGAAGEMTRGTVTSTLALLSLRDAASAAAGMALNLAGAGARYAADALSFRENTAFAFQILTRSASKAQELMGFSDELARSLGKSTVEVGGSVRELLSKGFDPEMIRSIVSGMADLSTINPDANVKLLTMAIGQVKSKGFLMMEELRGQIAEQGLDIQAVYKHIAQNLGIRQDEVEKAISGKKVTADTGITAILQAVQDMGGGGALGAVSAAKATQTLGGAFDNARSMAQRMLLAINTGPVGQKLIALTHRAANLFDPAQAGGKRMLAVLDRVVALGARVVESISLDDLGGAFELATSAGERFMRTVEPLSKGFGTGFREATSTLQELREMLGLSSASSETSASALMSVGKALGYITVGIGLVVGGMAWMAQTIVQAVLGLPDNMRFIGRELVTGLGAGIDSAKGWLVAKVEELAALLPDSVRKLLKIQSPSRVFMQIGAHTTAGFVAGLEQGPQPHARMVELMRPPPPEPLPAPGLTVRALAPRSAGTTGPVVLNLTVNVDGRDTREPEQLAERIGTEVRRQVAALFEELTLEAGAT